MRITLTDCWKQPSRFAHWPRWASVGVLAAVAALMLWGVILSPLTQVEPVSAPPVETLVAPVGPDVMLYHRVVERLRAGENYYAAASEAMRASKFPMRPFVTMRLPTLGWMLAALPEGLTLPLMAALLGGVMAAWSARLTPAARSKEAGFGITLCVMAAGLVGFSPALTMFHEGWAGLLVALSIALYRPDRWWPSVLAALAAVMIRELALPLVLMMGALAVLGQRWRECAAWAAVAVAFMAALAAHAAHVWAVTSAADLPSPGWAAGGGWAFVLSSVHKSTLLGMFPQMVTAILLPLSLLGWSAWRHPAGLRAFLFLSGFAVMMMIVGRPDNFYWAVMITPMLFMGALFAPLALRDLISDIRTPAAILT